MSSSSELDPENWDKVSEAFFFKSLRCLMNSLSEGKAVIDKRRASVGIGDGSFEGEGFEGEFFSCSPLTNNRKLLSI